MLPPLDAPIKRRWHDELVRDARTHAWVLNLYRAGERHPETVDDYFPIEHAPPWLADRLRRHRDDEVMHAKLYARTIERLGQPLEDFSGDDVFNVAIRACTTASFRISDHDDGETRTRKLAHFCAHAHFLEARIARSLTYHHAACVRAGCDDVARAVAVVLDDEKRHAQQTREAVVALLPPPESQAVLAQHARAERRANLAFSARQVRAHLARIDVGDANSTRLWRACATAMEWGAAHV